MKYLITLLALVFMFTLDLSGQSSPSHEVGLRLNSLRDFSFIYKKHRNENKYWRIRNFTSGINLNDFSESVQFGLSLGLEKRRSINPKLKMVTGPEFGVFTSIVDSSTGGDISFIRVTLSYIVGLNYTVNDDFIIGIEILPSLSVSESSLSLTSGWSTAALVGVYAFEGQLFKKSRSE